MEKIIRKCPESESSEFEASGPLRLCVEITNPKGDGFAKSPSAALRFIFRHCSVLLCTLQSSRFARLVPPVAGELFPVPSTLATFYEVIKGQWDDQVCCGADFEDVTEVLCAECGEELPEGMATMVKSIAFSFLTSNLDFAEWGSAFPNRLLGAAPSTGSAMVPIGSSSMATVIALQDRFPNHQECGLRKEVKCTKTEANPRPQIGRFPVAPLPRSWVASLGRSVTVKGSLRPRLANGLKGEGCSLTRSRG
jgi:hypothetical protein